MKKILILLALITSSTIYAATVTVPKFELQFNIEGSAYDLDFELEMACRYEKLVFSNSSEYEYKFKKVPLKVVRKHLSNGDQQVTVTNLRKRSLEQDDFFKSNQSCQTYVRFFFIDKKFAVGWGNQGDRPIRLGLFEHSTPKEYSVFDINKYKHLLGGRTVSFIYSPVGRQVNVSLAVDGVKLPGMSSYLFTSTAQDPETELPFRL